MGVTLKIRLHGRKEDLRAFWVPVVFELKPVGSRRTLRFIVENLDRNVKDEKDRRMSLFEIPNLPAGRYTLSILEFHTGHPIIQGKRVELKGKEVEFGPVQKIDLYLGTIKGEEDITNQIRFPRRRKKGYEFEGSIEQTFSKWKATPSYLRLEAASGIDPKSGEAQFRCVTNPIWIMTRQ